MHTDLLHFFCNFLDSVSSYCISSTKKCMHVLHLKIFFSTKKNTQNDQERLVTFFLIVLEFSVTLLHKFNKKCMHLLHFLQHKKNTQNESDLLQFFCFFQNSVSPYCIISTKKCMHLLHFFEHIKNTQMRATCYIFFCFLNFQDSVSPYCIYNFYRKMYALVTFF